MYKIILTGKYLATPWEIPSTIRFSQLVQAIQDRKKIAVLLYEQSDTSTFRYRAYNIHKSLLQSEEWRAVYFFKDEMDRLRRYLDRIHLLVVIRFRWCPELDLFMNRTRANAVPILFDIDDLVFDVRYIPLVTNTLNVGMKSEEDNNYWFSYVSRLGFAASFADGFTTTNPYLGNLLTQTFAKPTRIIRNAINDEQFHVSKRCLQAKQSQKSSRPFVIGYFSGTPSHINDFSLIYMEILQLLREFKDISLMVVGFMEFPAELQAFIDSGRIKYVPLVDFIELQRLIAEVDVNISPLVTNTFTNCKSELKFFEAALVKTITLSTPTYTFQNCITDGVNGFLCRQGEWYSKIKALYLRQYPIDEINESAFQYAVKRYYGDDVRKEIEACYNHAIGEQTSSDHG